LKISNREYLLAGILSLVLIGGFNSVFAVSTINFDATVDGTTITNQFQTDGATFSSATFDVKVLNDAGETPGPPSTPNILVSNYGLNDGDIKITVVDPVTPFAPTDASSISFKLFSIGNNAVTVVAKDFGNNVIDTQVFQHNDVGGDNCNYPTEWPAPDFCPGPITNGWAQTDSYSFSGNIRTVTITSQAFEGDGYGIDDVLVQFTSEPTVAGELVPLNTTALFISGLSSSMIWMVPTILGIAGVGVYIKSKKN
jgi:hypothetical protein